MGQVDDIVANTNPVKRDPCKPYLLAPIDLQAVKACGVTFVTSMVERVVEEMAKGDPSKAGEARAALEAKIGEDLRGIEPGSAEAARVKAVLVERGLWSQYLEVGLGPDVEIFTKAQPMSSVGHGDQIGLHPSSTWNNPEPEVVLIVSSEGEIVGATLGNDVNLRDVEGRSVLLLGRAKDNNASCAIGPFIRLFDDRFTLEDVRSLDLELRVEGPDAYVLEDTSAMRDISRDPQTLAEQLFDCHQYPDGTAFLPARCLRRPRTAMRPARVSLTRSATWSRYTAIGLAR
jgi:fumarylacetoacetate (FAA) hydrolase family protein